MLFAWNTVVLLLRLKVGVKWNSVVVGVVGIVEVVVGVVVGVVWSCCGNCLR